MYMSVKQIVQRQEEVLQAMGRIRVMRYGTITKQSYLQRAGRKEGKGAVGPYALWQGTVNGQRFGKRLSGEEVERVQEGIVQRRAFQALCEEYMALSCQLAELADQGEAQLEEVKKNLTYH